MGKGFKTLLTVFKESRKKSSSVQAALQSSTWLQDLDIHGHITVQLVKELVALWLALQEVQLMPGVDDEITWNWRTIDGRFTTASAYKTCTTGMDTWSILPFVSLHHGNCAPAPGGLLVLKTHLVDGCEWRTWS